MNHAPQEKLPVVVSPRRRDALRFLAALTLLSPMASLMPKMCGPRAAQAAPVWPSTPMDALTCIRTRRSVRAFTEEPVSEELIHAVLAAGMAAPSAGNEQPWHFVVVDDHAMMLRLSKTQPYVSYARKAPLGVVVCGDVSREKHKGNWPSDVAACTENMLLAAHALGLGAVWTGIWPEEIRMGKVAEICGLPRTVIPFAFVVMGHPASVPEPTERFDVTRIHKNGW